MESKSKKTWKQVIQPHLDKDEKEFKKIFAAFEKEKKAKNITSTADNNKLWNAKYKDKFDAKMKKSREEYTKIWTKYHQK
jgi:aminoglycoside N3'-acetyltransferase